MKKKILVCAYTCVSESGVDHAGGEAEMGYNLVLQLNRFFDVYVLTHYYNKKAIEEKFGGLPSNNINFFYVKLPKFFDWLEKFHKGGIQIYAYLWQIKAYFVAKKLHKEIKFDVFHHVTYANDWMASYVGALLPIPYVRGPGGGSHKVPKGFLKEYSFKNKLAEKIRGIGQWIFRHDPFFVIGQNKAKALLVCNKEAYNALPKRWQKKTSLFPVNGISIEDYFKPRKKIENDFIILSVGKLLKIKGFDLAMKAFADFYKIAQNAKLIIIGDGTEKDNLKNLARNLGIEDKVIFKGWLKREDVLQEMIDCDVFLFASLRDGGGNVVVEAMAQGKPVVCFDIAGPGFHIDDSCGIKIKPENPKQAAKDMAIALEKLYTDKELRLRLGEGARKKAEENYDWDKLGNRLQKIYEDILEK
jgi:glycosyltransferase involved in cell wall biosynthesis